MSRTMTAREVAAYNRDLAARITEASRRAWEESLAKQKPQAMEALLKWANTPEEYNPADDDYRRGFAAGRKAAKETILNIFKQQRNNANDGNI